MKIVLFIFLIFYFIFTFVSCGDKNNSSENTSEESSIYSDNGTTFTVTVSSSKYYINGTLAKSLTLKKGYTYYFDATDSTTNNHPLFISTISTGGSYSYEYNSGVTNSRTTTETLTFIVPPDSPLTLYYNCGNHVAMGGTITII